MGYLRNKLWGYLPVNNGVLACLLQGIRDIDNCSAVNYVGTWALDVCVPSPAVARDGLWREDVACSRLWRAIVACPMAWTL